MGVPVLAADHGSSSELLDSGALLRTKYHTDKRFSTHFAAPLGTVDVDAAVEMLLGGGAVRPSRAHAAYERDAERFIALVHGRAI